MKLWIIYKEGVGLSMIIAEMLQDRLEDYIDVFVGNAKKVDPVFLVEEKLDYLIVGDVINEKTPSSEIQNWLTKYSKVSKNKNLIVRAVSGYYVALTNGTIQPSRFTFQLRNILADNIYPPILSLKINKADLSLENGSLESINEFSNLF
ncbi:MAG: hypothetical protein ACFFE4_23540, partial [Candidatus Thorarchaeota archaeon]